MRNNTAQLVPVVAFPFARSGAGCARGVDVSSAKNTTGKYCRRAKRGGKSMSGQWPTPKDVNAVVRCDRRPGHVIHALTVPQSIADFAGMIVTENVQIRNVIGRFPQFPPA